MGIANWLWVMNELLKSLLIVWGILGFSISKKTKIRKVVLFLLCNLCFSYLFVGEKEQYAMLSIFAFIIIFLADTIINKAKGFLVAELILATGDLFFANLFSVVLRNDEMLKKAYYLDFLFDVFWIALVVLVHRYRKTIYDYFVNLPILWFVLLFSMLFGLGLMAGIMHYIINGGLTRDFSGTILLVYTSVMLLFLVAGGVFIYYVVSKKNLSRYIEQEKEKYFLEKRYYEGKIKKNEEIQRFRHDMKKHMKIIRQLCDEITDSNYQIERLREYVENYLDTYPEHTVVYTGNIITDYFISELIDALGKNDKFKYDIIGRLPKKISISDTDLSILLGNALDNVKEELLKIEDECYFRISFKNYKSNLIIKIENTKSLDNGTKNKGDGHGYGIKNMREVVNRYKGTLEIIETEESFCVDIFI